MKKAFGSNDKRRRKRNGGLGWAGSLGPERLKKIRKKWRMIRKENKFFSGKKKGLCTYGLAAISWESGKVGKEHHNKDREVEGAL